MLPSLKNEGKTVGKSIGEVYQIVRLAILNGGGDAPALNAVLRAEQVSSVPLTKELKEQR